MSKIKMFPIFCFCVIYLFTEFLLAYSDSSSGNFDSVSSGTEIASDAQIYDVVTPDPTASGIEIAFDAIIYETAPDKTIFDINAGFESEYIDTNETCFILSPYNQLEKLERVLENKYPDSVPLSIVFGCIFDVKLKFEDFNCTDFLPSYKPNICMLGFHEHLSFYGFKVFNCTRHCLLDKGKSIVQQQNETTCENITQQAFESFSDCFVKCGFCGAVEDWMKYFRMWGQENVDSKYVAKIMEKCANFYVEQGKEKFANFVNNVADCWDSFSSFSEIKLKVFGWEIFDFLEKNYGELLEMKREMLGIF